MVTDHAVHLQYGLWGPTISLDAIESVEIAKYDWTRFGGWGLRGTGDERAFTIQGHDDATLCVRWREDGVLKTVWFSTEDPANTMLAIERARAARKASPRVRVAFAEGAPDTADATPDTADATESETSRDEREARAQRQDTR